MTQVMPASRSCAAREMSEGPAAWCDVMFCSN
eukprot:CAMPEP_0179351792 /NCGR_PEP_ID=MMETSP0797-20121207/75460_1 /TAXON_ID=47934 /ORGANISM="Dinophysis acuminata, Strain DAEP01" /LENGTH=31 /DNA_ID= /DNA_START= /DNA_END= /DNA_ORIENTATION=